MRLPGDAARTADGCGAWNRLSQVFFSRCGSVMLCRRPFEQSWVILSTRRQFRNVKSKRRGSCVFSWAGGKTLRMEVGESLTSAHLAPKGLLSESRVTFAQFLRYVVHAVGVIARSRFFKSGWWDAVVLLRAVMKIRFDMCGAGSLILGHVVGAMCVQLLKLVVTARPGWLVDTEH